MKKGMKKKIIALALVAALGASAAIGGSLAYFTDTDSATNTMTLGNVDITQNERDQAGADFEDQPLFPMVNKMVEGDATFVDGYFNPKMENVIDKVITVTNDGSEEAYVRTIIAFETATEYVENTDTVRRSPEEIFEAYIGVLGKGLTYTDEVITIGDAQYILAYKTYAAPLASGDTSEPSLKQFFLSPEADNEVTKLFGAEYKILAVSQAVQTEGFDTAEEALNEAFGEVNAANAAAWF